jgi:hypothetical protein
VVDASVRRAGARRGLVVWLLLAALTATIVVLESRDRRRDATGHGERADPGAVLSVPVEQLGAVEIADRGRLHRFERDAAGAWLYHGEHSGAAADHTHTTDPELARRIEAAFAAFGRARIERRFPLDRGGAAYGLAAPELLILVYRPSQSQPLAQFAVGDLAPDTASRYVMRVGSPEVITIPQYQIDNLLALVREVADPTRQGTASRS